MKKVGHFFLAVLPLLGMLAVTFITSQVIQTVLSAKFIAQNGMVDQQTVIDYLVNYLQGDNLMKVLGAGQLINFVIGILILKLALKDKKLGNPFTSFPKATFPGVILTAAGIELLLSLILILASSIAPNAMEAYAEMISQSGMAGLTVISTIVTLIGAPVVEEIVFRGLTLKILENGGYKFLVANAIQALLFGIAHLNLVQGLYAFALGFILGLIFKKVNSLWASILAHLTFNFFGTYGSKFFYGSTEEITALTIILPLVVGAVFTVAGVFLLKTKKEEVSEVA